MNESRIRNFNEMIKDSTREDVEQWKKQLLFTDRQLQIFELKYERGLQINTIAGELGFGKNVIDRELRVIRGKIEKIK